MLPLVLLALALGCARPSEPSRPPDVVLVAADTLRADRLSCTGYPRPTTPFLDRLAREGALFEDVTSQFSWTIPSMISLFTGHELAGRRLSVLPGEPTLARTFRRAGYATLAVVSNVTIQEDTGLSRGFDRFLAPDPNGHLAGEWSLDEVAERALAPLGEILRERPRRPVFLYLHAMEAHDPYRPRAGTALAGADPKLRSDSWHARFLEEVGLGERVPELLASARLQRDRYDRAVRDLDGGLERLFSRLDRLGLLENALFAFFADHGEGLWDHRSPADTFARALAAEGTAALHVLYQKHGACQYQEVISTPLVLWGRGIPTGRRVSDAVENVDLFPTLLELAGLPARRRLEGRSLVPVLEGAERPSRAYVHSFGAGASSVREVATGLKLIVRPGRPRPGDRVSTELYDLGRDPDERENLAASRRGDVRRLLEVQERWADAHPVPVAVDTPEELERRLAAIGYSADDV